MILPAAPRGGGHLRCLDCCFWQKRGGGGHLFRGGHFFHIFSDSVAQALLYRGLDRGARGPRRGRHHSITTIHTITFLASSFELGPWTLDPYMAYIHTGPMHPRVNPADRGAISRSLWLRHSSIDVHINCEVSGGTAVAICRGGVPIERRRGRGAACLEGGAVREMCSSIAASCAGGTAPALDPPAM